MVSTGTIGIMAVIGTVVVARIQIRTVIVAGMVTDAGTVRSVMVSVADIGAVWMMVIVAVTYVGPVGVIVVAAITEFGAIGAVIIVPVAYVWSIAVVAYVRAVIAIAVTNVWTVLMIVVGAVVYRGPVIVMAAVSKAGTVGIARTG